MERVFSILNREPAVEDRSGAVALTGLRQGIVFRDVCFSYDGVTPILRNVSFEAKAGEMVAIVGPSGAGKTTLLDLLVRFYEPKSGEILLDGRDIREIKRSSLLEHIAMVTQDPFLFNVSIRENILYGRPTATLEELEDAARAAHVEEFIRYIPDGYEARVGERGVLLSGGQKQRITIARALLRNAPILILDEATSNLDSESERLIQEALPRLVKGRTTFVIAHRLSTVRAADRIVVMNEGSVAETGTHDELLSRSGLYRHLHELQFSA
jgi:subfamily B ATP-binding cassette protein MsbA